MGDAACVPMLLGMHAFELQRVDKSFEARSQHRALIGILWLAAVGANPDALGVVDGVMARTAVRAHRKHSSAPANYLAFFRGCVVRDFATLIFL